jgi:hypothetical protein
MSYIAFELDALNVAPDVANAAGIEEARVTHGLLRMWAWCFRAKVDRVSPLQVKGFFGTDAVEALSVFGFLALDGDSLRVRGAERYLRISEARRKGAAATNAKRRSSDAQRRHQGRSASDAQATLKRRSEHALTPSTEHLSSSTDDEEEASDAQATLKRRSSESMSGPVVVEAPTSPPDEWGAEDFWAWAQSRRQAGGMLAERNRPRGLGAWYSAALMTPGVTPKSLQEAFYRFGQDGHWEKANPPFPFAAFVRVWANFHPEVSHASRPAC